MVRKLRLKLVVGIGMTLTTSFQAAAQSVSAYVNKYRPLANALALEFGIPPAIILGVATVESSSGQARNCRDLNNHFGITGSNHVARKTRYKQYDSPEASFRDFCLLLTRRSFYQQLKGSADVTRWISAISRTGYSVAPQAWSGKIISAIRNNKL